MGFGSGYEKGASAAKNPFATLLDSIGEGMARRRSEDKKRADEENELRKAIVTLGAKNEYDTTLMKETALTKGVAEGTLSETEETGKGTIAGTFFGKQEGRFQQQPKNTKNIADPTGLSSEQQIQARSLSKKISGVRGAEYGLPAIFEEMRKGKSIDEIEDSLRYAGQSPEFTGAVRNAAQSVLINTDQNKAQTAMDYIDDFVSRGDTEQAKTQLKRLARTQASAEESRFVVGKERTIKLLDDVQNDFNKLESMGINTNIFTGTAEEVAKKAGTVVNPEARKLATKIAAALQSYRRSMTGVQFGMPENKEYKDMFPGIGRTKNFNTASINALKEVLSGDLDNFYSLSMGENNYNTLFGNGKQAQNQTSGGMKYIVEK